MLNCIAIGALWRLRQTAMNPEFTRFITDVPAAVALFDRDLRYVAASRDWITAFGLSRRPLAGHGHEALSRIGRAVLSDVQQRALAGECVVDRRIPEDRLPPRAVLGARPHRGADGAIEGVILALQGVSLSALGQAVAPDPLTGLADRSEFADRLHDILASPEPANRAAMVFAINLDSLRTINNLHGTKIGDEALKVAAGRLLSSTRSSPTSEESRTARSPDMVARLSADQFGIIGGPLQRADAEAVAARFLRIMQSPIAVGAQSLRLNASIGFIVTGPEHGDENDALRDLDLALQHAQSVGPSRVIAWEPAMTRAANQRYSLAEQLRRAFDNGEFALRYQPLVRLRDGRMVGAEALLRWNHPSEGLVAPGAFLPALEESGLIVEVGCWVIREVVRQVESWHMLYGRDIVDWVAVNLSARQFNDPAPLLTTLRCIYDRGFSVNRLKFEIAETALTRKPEISRAALAELEQLGVRVAIDDFGTGHSSLTSLRHYPVDTIKIDGEFIGQIGTPQGEKLVEALLNIARGYGASIIAEGIETAAQRDFLRASGCDLGQGYLFAEPMQGAQLGAYALIHAVNADRAVPPVRSAGGGAAILQTSAGP
jgi:diguanylate cyclase (GGDEF)-like protein